ncbi:MAG TPA: response regulator [Hanamia sp.]|jgi:DNA-binding response OmpR family regulator|nr:response regulator [Hanamia sp.]
MNKILVVDDDIDILSLVKIMLTMNHFDVEAISRWEEIDTRLHDFKPDLVLLDVSLGDADGRDICKQMRTAKETSAIPVILFSANAEMGKYIDDCRAQAFIPKPFELSYLINTIKTYLN